MQNKNDILCFRHARSEFNKGQHMYYDQAPGKEFSYFYNMPQFCSEVLYNPVYIDTRLSDVGIEQCKNAQGNEQLKKVDVVLVSPLNRALETAKIAFGDLGIPIVVHSELSESFRYGCDLSDPIQEKKKEFPNFDFSNMKDCGEGWEITKNLSERNQLLYNKFAENHKKDDLKEHQIGICSLLSGKQFGQNNGELRSRMGKVKQLLKKYREKHQTVAIVSHWWVITFLLAENFNEDNYPVGVDFIKNAEPYWTSLDKLLQYK